MVKNPPAVQEMQETQVWSLGWDDPLKKDMVTHSNILAWEVPWTERLVSYSPQDHKDSDVTEHAQKVQAVRSSKILTV